MRYKIAYIDEEDGWLNLFYQTFKNSFEIKKIKIDENSTLEHVVKEVTASDIHGIVTDYQLDETGYFNGNMIVDEIRRIRPHFPIMMLTSFQPQAISHMEDVNIINDKDDLDGENEKKVDILRSKIQTNIERYFTKIDRTESKIEELVAKRNSGMLEPIEEEELTKLFILMDELIPEGKEIPSNLITSKAITAISDFVKETRMILDELKKDRLK